MTIRDLVTAYLLADGAVMTVIGTRLVPDMLPEKINYPAGVIQAVDIIRPNPLRGVASLATARIQVDIYAAPASGVSSRALADQGGAAVRRRLDGFDGTFMDETTSPATPVRAWITFEQERTLAEPEIHGGLSRHSADYLVQFQTQGGLY